jgi:hypothetical protein
MMDISSKAAHFISKYPFYILLGGGYNNTMKRCEMACKGGGYGFRVDFYYITG